MKPNSAPAPSVVLESFVLLLGALLGYGLAWWLHGFDFGTPGELAAARASGIVSRTILAGYAKSRDTWNYALVLLLPVAGALLAQRSSRVRSPLGAATLAGGFDRHGFAHWLYWPLIAALAAWSWHATAILAPPWNGAVGAWPFLGEQGATLAWAQNIEAGGVYGRDFFSLYGPMFVYPLVWLMDLAGDHSALMERYYKLLLQLIAFALLAFVLLRTLRSRVLACALAIAIVFLYPALGAPSANTTVLRPALALFALAAALLWIDTRRTRWLACAGLALGQSFLFSQEAALCAFGAGTAALWLDARAKGAGWAAAATDTAWLWGTTLLSMAPMLLYLMINGAGPALLDSLVGYPRQVLLGFGALPFPSLRDWLPGAPREHALHYVVIAIYSASAVALAIAWGKGARSPRLLWAIALTLFGVVLFRQALGRSEPGQTIKVMLPAILLAGLWLDEAGQRLGRWRTDRGVAAVAGAGGTVVLAALLWGIGGDPTVRGQITTAWWLGAVPGGKFAAAPALAAQPVHPRVGFPLDARTGQAVAEIDGFLRRNTMPEEPVYFFPNEAAYYHLFDRTNPTRYAVGYFAASFERQRELVQDLEARRPRFVVYSKWTWRIDGIPENVQIPLVVEYLMRHYHPVLSLQQVEILARN